MTAHLSVSGGITYLNVSRASPWIAWCNNDISTQSGVSCVTLGDARATSDVLARDGVRGQKKHWRGALVSNPTLWCATAALFLVLSLGAQSNNLRWLTKRVTSSRA